MNSPLERRYRRLLRILPEWYRRDRADEMVATLLEGREARLDRGPGLAESLSVLGLAVRTRLSATAPTRAMAAGNVARGIVLFGLAIAGITAVDRLYDWAYFTAKGYPANFAPLHMSVLLLGYLAVPATFTAVMLGRVRLARVLGILTLIPGASMIMVAGRAGYWDMVTNDVIANITLWLAVLCLFFAVGRVVRRASPLWWWAAGVAVVFGLGDSWVDTTPMTGTTADLWWAFAHDTVPGWVVALGCVSYLLAIRKRFDRAGSGALTLSAAALVTMIVQFSQLLLGAYGLANGAMPRFVVFACLTGLLLVFVVVLATIGIRRYRSLPQRRLAAAVESVEAVE
ncbi:MAG TPA: hypothetical protein VHZ97_24240 [Pseudonocardiaceae bacterium]|nr:hypothetical protein [Pseudonocardiaceae bacterium]